MGLLVSWWLLRLQWRRNESLPRSLRRMAGWAGHGSATSSGDAARVVSRVFRYARRIPGLWSSCIPRSLILAGLLGDSSRAELKVGFPHRPGGEGHAWVAIDGEALLDEDRALLAREPHAEIESLPLGGPRRVK